MSAKECEGLYVRCCECGVMINESEWEAHAIAPCAVPKQHEAARSAEGARGVRAASALVADMSVETAAAPELLDTIRGAIAKAEGGAS